MRALAVLPGSFSPAMLVQALNISIVNFPTAGAEIPPESLPLIREAATRLRQLPPGTVIDPARENQRLRQNAALGQPGDAGDTPIIQRRRPGLFSGLF